MRPDGRRRAGGGFSRSPGRLAKPPNPQQQAAIDARGSTFVSAGAGTGKTTVLVERFARAVIDDGLDVDSLLVITYTDRAAGELRAQDPGPTARARAARSGARPRRRLDLDDPRLLPPAPDRVPARRRHRPAVPRARRVAGARAAGRGVQRRPGRVLRRRRARPLAAARDLQGGGAPQDARQRLRHAALGRTQADPRAGRCARASPTPSPTLLVEADVDPRRRARRPTRCARPRATCSTCSRRRGCRSASSSSPSRRSAARAPRPSATPARRCGRSRSRSSPPATASCSRSCSPASPPPTPRRRIASRRSTSRTCSSAPASCCARTTRSGRSSSSASARSWSTSSRTRTASRPTSSTCSAPARRRSCSSSATSSSRSTASGTPMSRCSATAARRRRRCCR